MRRISEPRDAQHRALNENEIKTLDYLGKVVADEDQFVLGYRRLSGVVDLSPAGVQKLCQRLQSWGYLRIDVSEGTEARIGLTSKGALMVARIRDTQRSVNGEGQDLDFLDCVDVHYVTARASVENAAELNRWKERHGKEWRSVVAERKDFEWQWSANGRGDGGDMYAATVPSLEGARIVLHRDCVEFYLRDPAASYSPQRAMRQVIDRLEKAVEWVNGYTPAHITMQGVEIETTHSALVKHPLAELARELGIDQGDVSVVDRETGREERAVIEASEDWELEFKGSDTAVQDSTRMMEDWLDVFVHEPEAIRALVERGRELADVDAEPDVSEATPDAGQTLVGDYYDSEMRDALDRVNMR